MKNKALVVILLIVGFVATSLAQAEINTDNLNTQFTPANKMLVSDWSDPAELQRVWDASIVVFPSSDRGYTEARVDELDHEALAQKRFPLVIMLPGCAGVGRDTYQRMDYLVANGFATLTPVSFARKKIPQSCDLVGKRFGLYRGILQLRKYELTHVIQQARVLPWVDEDRIYLLGHSEGGVVAATFNNPETPVRARVIESWNCESGWNEYNGMQAPASEPVLALLAADDPWLGYPGDCGKYLVQDNGSQSIVFEEPELRGQHGLLLHEPVQKIVLDFLLQH